MLARHAALPAAVLGAAAALTLCTACGASSGSSHHSSSAAPSEQRPTSSAVAATRWWSNPAASVGSTVGPNDKAATSLVRSGQVYCTMLRQTIAAGKSVLPGATATSPALASTTEAFVDELSKVAPVNVAPAWHVLGPVLVDVVKSSGSFAALRTQVDVAAVSAAAQTVAADAQTSCGLDLSAK